LVLARRRRSRLPWTEALISEERDAPFNQVDCRAATGATMGD
jgi:hypothetical protein